MEYILPAASAIVVAKLIEQEIYPARVDHLNTYADMRYTKLQVGLLMK